MGRATLAGSLLLLFLGAVAQAQEKKPNETISIPGTDLTFEMVYVPGGKAKSGEPPMEVELRPYWMSKTEVTWECFVKYFENRKQVKVDGVTRPSPPYEPPHGKMGTGAHQIGRA